MRKIWILALSALAVLASCTREEAFNLNETPDDAVLVKGKVTFTASLPAQTKTALGVKDGDTWPNYWCTGDVISVNGVNSEALDASFNGLKSAKFTVDGVAATYNAGYPASAFSAYSVGTATVTVPAAQTYVAGTYDPAAYVMLASSGTSTLSFQPQMAIFKLTPTGSKQIVSVSITALGSVKLAGQFSTDFSGLTPGAGATSTVTVTAASPVDAGTPWFIVLPAVDLRTDGFQIVVQDNDGGSMTRQTKPSKAWAAGKMYSAEIPYTADAFSIAAEGITSSTAVICITGSPADAYTVNVYSDAGCSSLVNTYSIPAGAECWGGESPRFCVSGLAPGTTYYVKVSDVTSSKDSSVLPVTTAAFDIVLVSSTPANVDDVILAEDFGELRWDSELITRGVGYFPTSQDSFDNTEVGSFLKIDTNSEKTLGSQTTALASSRLAHWAQGANNNLYIHPGYIKLVGSKNVTHLVTPALDNIPEGKLATLEVEVTACPYYSESSGSYATMNAIVAVQPAGSYQELGDNPNTNAALDLSTNIQPVTLDAVTAWKTYKVTLTGVGKGARLAFGAAAEVTQNNARMNISDMKVTIKALEDPALVASVKAVSSSTAAFTWTYGGEVAADIAKPYTIALYSDSACSNLVVSYSINAGNECWDSKTPCFVFGGLNPSTEYWFVATDTDAAVSSDPVSVTTDAFTVVDATTVVDAAVGDVILAEDFSEIGWGPDEFAVAAGFVPNPKTLAVPSGVSPEGIFITYSNTGNRIFGSGVDLGSSRLSKGWGFFGNSAVYLRNAYLRIATTQSGARTHLVTPALSGIPAGKLATIEVTVTATKHESNANDIAVFVEKGLTMNGTSDTNSGSYKKYTGASLSDGHALGISTVKSWATKSVTITNVDSDCQLVIGSYENIDTKNRFSITDVKVTITALADDPVFKIKDEATFQAFVSEVAGGNKTLDAEVKADVVISSSAADAFSSIEDYEGTLNGNGYTISGLTKPLFNELKGTVKNLTVNSTLNITADQADLGILANTVSGTVTGCTSKGSVTFNVAAGVTGEHRIGGLIGSVASSGAEVSDCTNEASVTNSTSNTGDGELLIGGLIGSFWGTEFHISGCENTGGITNTASWAKTMCIGGVMGQGGNDSSASSDLTIASCTNSGAVSNSGTSDASIELGGIAGFVRFAVMTSLSNSGDISNSGTAGENVCIGGLLGWVDKNCTMTQTKATNSGSVTNSGSGKLVSIGGILGRNSSGYLNATGTSSNYLTNNGTVSDESSTDADDLSIGGIVGYTTTGIKLQYARNNGEIKVLNGTRDADVEIGGVAGWLNNGSLNVNNCKNYGDITVSSTINGSLFAGGIVGLFNVGHTTDKYNLVFEATIDTHLATVSGENYTAGLFGAHSGTGKATYLFNGLKFNGTVYGNKTKTGLLCNSRNAESTVTFKGSCKIAPGSVRKDDNNNNTVNSDSDLTMDVICGYLGSGSAVSGVSVEAY